MEMAVPTNTIALVVDTQLRRPGCVLLQAAFGCGENNRFMATLFDAADWVISPSEHLAVVRGTSEQWRKLAAEITQKKQAHAH